MDIPVGVSFARQETGIHINIVYSMLSCHEMQLNLQHRPISYTIVPCCTACHWGIWSWLCFNCVKAWVSYRKFLACQIFIWMPNGQSGEDWSSLRLVHCNEKQNRNSTWFQNQLCSSNIEPNSGQNGTVNVKLEMRICKRGSIFGIFAQSKWILCEYNRSEQENWAITTWIQYNRCDSHHIVMNYWRCRVDEYSDFQWRKNVWLIPLLI